MSGIYDETVEYGEGGFDPSKPDNNEVLRRQVELPQRDANERDIYDKARQGISANKTYLALATPTAAQNAAQVRRLTRQVNALIRLTLRDLEDVSDT